MCLCTANRFTVGICYEVDIFVNNMVIVYRRIVVTCIMCDIIVVMAVDLRFKLPSIFSFFTRTTLCVGRVFAVIRCMYVCVCMYVCRRYYV